MHRELFRAGGAVAKIPFEVEEVTDVEFSGEMDDIGIAGLAFTGGHGEIGGGAEGKPEEFSGTAILAYLQG
ncbi:hypothetical protein EG867_16820, partial [Enterococcus faecalis]